MSGLFGWSSTQFDKLLEKATSHLLLEPDWDTILQICDCIRQNDVQPKYVVSCLKKKLYAQNPHVVLYTLQVLESIVKNCGAPIHAEIASRPFMEELRDVVKNSTNENVKNRILELIQAWAYAFRNEPKYRAVQDVFNLLRMEGYKLQVLKESDAMFVADTAPDWADSDCCHRCRVQFTVVQRKHHCRNCGQIFCKSCSSRTTPIPRYGFEKEVRVCEACWENLSKPSAAAAKSSPPNAETSPKQAAKSSPAAVPAGGKSEQELKEEEELQLALALSQSEAESKEKPQVINKSPSHNLTYSSSLPETETIGLPKKSSLTSSDSELDRYLNRSYWEQRQQQQKEDIVVAPPPPVSDTRTSPIPSAPISSPAIQTVNYNSNKISEKYQNGDIDEMSGFLGNLKSSLEIFVNRMKSNSSRGRPIANDTYVQSQFMNITNMHSQLLKYIQEQEDSRAHYESLQDKLNQIRDARAALDALRDEHQEKLRREAEEAERQRQIQMAYKLEIMRKKKQEYLQYQRQLAIQRMHEQEREMQLRHEQQKQQYVQVIHPGNGGAPPAGYPPQQQQPPPYMPSGAPQGYPPGMQNAGGRPTLPGQQPYPQQFQPPQPDPQHMQTADYRQPFNMQAMGGALPAVPPGVQFPQQPRIPASSAAPAVTSAQNQMIPMHPGMMGPMPGQMGPMMPPNMGQVSQNAATPNHQHQMPPGAMPRMIPGQEQGVASPERPQEKESEPLIVFD